MFMPIAIRLLCKIVSPYKYKEVYKYSSICAVPFYSSFFPESDETKCLLIGYVIQIFTLLVNNNVVHKWKIERKTFDKTLYVIEESDKPQ